MPPSQSLSRTSPRARGFHRLEFPEALALFAVLALAAGLRLHGLGTQSLWADEGNSWAMALRPLAQIGPASGGDIHPPLYYYLLNLWCRLTGTSEAGLRSLSAVSGWLLVPVTYLLGRRLIGRAGGLAAAALAALSPFAVYYSQEARSYALVTLLAAAATLALLAYLDGAETGRRRGAAIAYVLLAAAMLWTHYLGIVVLALHNLLFAVRLLAGSGRLEPRPLLRFWATVQAPVLLLFAPWLPVMLRHAGGWPAISEQHSLGFYLAETARLFAVGPTAEAPAWVVVAAMAPVLAALALSGRRGRSSAVLLLLSYAAFPGLALWALSLLRPAYRAKFLLVGIPAYHILAAAGAVWSAALVRRYWRHLPPALLAGLLLIGGPALASRHGLTSLYSDTGRYRDDYRGLARFLQAAAGPDDAIILNAPGQMEVFSYYYQGAGSLYPLPRERPADEAAVTRALQDLAARHRRAYAVLWATGESDPQGHVEGWLDANAYKAMDTWYGNVRLAAYELPPSLPREQQANALFGGKVALASYALTDGDVAPGTAWPVELHWRLTEQSGTRYKLFLQALDANSNIVGQRDTEPLSGRRPTSAWAPGEEIVDRQALPVHLGTPPGTYTVIAGLYDAATGARLPLPDGSDRLVLGEMRVGLPQRDVPVEALRPLVRSRIALGPLRLLGWDPGLLGEAPRRAIAATAGRPLSLVLYWSVAEPQPARLEFALEGKGDDRLLAEREVLQGTYPAREWRVDQVLRDPHILFLPGDLAPGSYILSLRVQSDLGTGRVDLATVAIEP